MENKNRCTVLGALNTITSNIGWKYIDDFGINIFQEEEKEESLYSVFVYFTDNAPYRFSSADTWGWYHTLGTLEECEEALLEVLKNAPISKEKKDIICYANGIKMK